MRREIGNVVFDSRLGWRPLGDGIERGDIADRPVCACLRLCVPTPAADLDAYRRARLTQPAR